MMVWMGDEDRKRLDIIAEIWQDIILNIRGKTKKILRFFMSKIAFIFSLFVLCSVIFFVRLIIGGQRKK